MGPGASYGRPPARPRARGPGPWAHMPISYPRQGVLSLYWLIYIYIYIWQVFLIEVRSTRIRGRKKRHENVKSACLAISGQNGHVFSSFFDCQAVYPNSWWEKATWKSKMSRKAIFLWKWLKMTKTHNFFEWIPVSVMKKVESLSLSSCRS